MTRGRRIDANGFDRSGYPVPAGEPVGRQELAEAGGVAVSSIDTYLRRGTAPAPDGYVGRAPFWRRSTVEHWAKHRRTQVGKPPKAVKA